MFRKHRAKHNGIVSLALIIGLALSMPGVVLLQTSERKSEVRPTDKAKPENKTKDENHSDPDLIAAENMIAMTEGKGKNSFANAKSMGGEDMVRIVGAENKGKLISGAFDVVIRCIDSTRIIWQSAVFKAGRSELRSVCSVKTVIILLAYIVLKEGADTNGYKTKELGGGQILINIEGVKNPLGGGLLDGEFNFVLKCKQIIGLIAFTVVIAKGYAEQKAKCAIERDPRIYY